MPAKAPVVDFFCPASGGFFRGQIRGGHLDLVDLSQTPIGTFFLSGGPPCLGNGVKTPTKPACAGCV